MAPPADDSFAPALPLPARNAFAELLTESLRDPRRREALQDALRCVDDDATSEGTLGAATEALAAAGFEPGLPWHATAVRTLRAYVEVTAAAPVGTGLEHRLLQVRHLLGQSLYFEVHEVLEPAWLAAQGSRKRWLQGLIQAAVAWHHWRASNEQGAASLAGAASEKLRDAPPVWHGLEVAEIAGAIEAWSRWLASGSVGPAPARPLVSGRGGP